jgi:pimeloyl-ACP methyl ester carboxylesterase
MDISTKMRLLGFLGGAIMTMAAVPDSHATRAPIMGCSSLTTFTSPTVPKVVITSAVLTAATQSLPEHCLIDGKINERVGVGGQIYAIKFRVRMPTAWNERFYMGGGGGSNGTVEDPTSVLPQGFVTIGTDSGHDNATNNDPNVGGTNVFSIDPQARIDFAYNSYDQTVRVGKQLVDIYYGKKPKFSYFVGCSEGGAEAMLMAQTFPRHFDGIVAGDPGILRPFTSANGSYGTQVFAKIATSFDSAGNPLINKTYTDQDLLLVRNAVLAACDRLDGLEDGIVDNMPACTSQLVNTELAAVTCTGAKTASCLAANQVEALQTWMAGMKDSQGTVLYSGSPLDPGIGGQSGSTFNQGWRSWVLGSFNSATNNAQKVTRSCASSALRYTAHPVIPFVTAEDCVPFQLNFDFDTLLERLNETSGIYTVSAVDLGLINSTDLSAFKAHGGKLIVYHGGADGAFSVNATIDWYNGVKAENRKAEDFARLFVVPGMNHCSGGPSTDDFDMFPEVVNWVEKGVAPDSVVATASNPGYFGVESRSRPLCPYPKQARYKGSGDINDVDNFRCVAEIRKGGGHGEHHGDHGKQHRNHRGDHR